MPSRTYIQMILKLYKNNKVYLPNATFKALKKYNAVIENHPEAVEEIIQRRVDMIRYTKDILPDEDIMIIHLVIFEECILESMFIAEFIEPPVFKFDDFNTSSNLQRIAAGFQPVMSNAVVKVDWSK